MLTRINKVLIGKDIARDAQAVAGANIKTLVSELADGEVLVLDKYKKVLAAGSTVADSDTIYICQATSKTFDYTNEAGTTVTGARELIFSDPIQGKNVKSYKGRSYVAKAEQTAAIDLTGLTPVAGTEYVIRIIYRDMEEYPSQFTQTYRYIATAADAADLDVFAANWIAKITKHKGRRVNAAYVAGTDVITLTARAIPECTTSLTDIDSFKQVKFDVRFLYVTIKGAWATVPATVTTVTYTGPTAGVGTWEQVRDLEKEALPYVGVSNFTDFPIITPAFSTVKGGFYDLIVIEFDRTYMSPGINITQNTPLTLVIAMATASTGINASTQVVSLLAQLNPWMASTPGSFPAISL